MNRLIADPLCGSKLGLMKDLLLEFAMQTPHLDTPAYKPPRKARVFAAWPQKMRPKERDVL
jgi:hypothetical protein